MLGLRFGLGKLGLKFNGLLLLLLLLLFYLLLCWMFLFFFGLLIIFLLFFICLDFFEDVDVLGSMLILWYMSGYYIGYYMGFR